MQKPLAQITLDQLAAERFTAEQAAREMPEAVLVENAWRRWNELFCEGLYTEARRFFAAHKQLMIGAA